MSRDDLANILARAVISQYTSLPLNGKPRPRTNGIPTWTVLAGFCLYRTTGDSTEARCVSLGTGLKALPHSKLPLHGDVLHDSHAEVIARRGLKLWLYRQLELAAKGAEATVFERTQGAWRLKQEWNVGLWISTLPCGDASTYSLSLSALTLPSAPSSSPETEAIKPPDTDRVHPSLGEAATLGLVVTRSSTPPPLGSSLKSDPLVHRGRVSYATISALRTKPGRADSPPTTSHSCSDKLAMWTRLGIQGGLLSTLDVHVKLDFISISGVKGSDEEVEKIGKEIRRAIVGRLEERKEPRDERVKVPGIGLSQNMEFGHSREAVARNAGVKEEEVLSCPDTLAWAENEGSEVITNGIRQGASSKRKSEQPLGAKARSRLSKLSLFQRHLEVQQSLLPESPRENLTYFQSKHSTSAAPSHNYYQEAKAAVRAGPFRGWLVSGKRWESFDADGKHWPEAI
ncbi:tRNA-specific adenosine deaminase [Sporobolomyces salmoneus]|uniref:tRNA-specific adenosine deaminase n=1 Tax=Sporobolomyces salmoneus TaxID=183962 RepID=UPI00317343DB